MLLAQPEQVAHQRLVQRGLTAGKSFSGHFVLPVALPIKPA